MRACDITQVVPLVFEQAGISDLKTACQMMQVSKAFKAAMSSCEPCLHVELLVGGLEDLEKVAEFTFWLQKNSHLIKDLFLDYCKPEPEPGAWRAAQSMLSFAFSSAGAICSPLRMQAAVTARGNFSHVMISSLPPSNLTTLRVPRATVSELQQPSLVSSMQQLTALQKLRLAVVHPREGDQGDLGDLNGERVLKLVPSGFLSTLQGLHSLRTVDLTIYNCTWPSLRCLPSLVQELSIFTMPGRCLLDIPQLTCLQKLRVQASGGIAEGSAFPPSVPVVTFSRTPLPADPCRLLAGVQQLHCTGSEVQAVDVLVQLSALQSLTQLSLSYDTLQSAAAAAPAWRHLQQLRSLKVYRLAIVGLDSAERWHAVLEGIGEAQGLTCLGMDIPDSPLPLPWGETIARIRNLDQLRLVLGNADRQNMLHLRMLTQPTGLKLYFNDMDDGTAAAVLLQLTNLRSLELSGGVGIANQVQMSDAVLPVLAQLKGLRDLKLSLPGVTENSLPLLEGLTQLEWFGMRLSHQSLEHLGCVLRCKVCLAL